MNNPFVAGEPKRRVAKMTPPIKRKFCEALASGASPTKATKAIGIARSTAYYQGCLVSRRGDVRPRFEREFC